MPANTSRIFWIPALSKFSFHLRAVLVLETLTESVMLMIVQQKKLLVAKYFHASPGQLPVIYAVLLYQLNSCKIFPLKY